MREAIRAAIATRLNSNWNTAGVCPLVFANQDGATSRTATAWARVVIQFARGEAAAVGTQFMRETGLVQVQVFIPKGGGVAVSTKAADELARILQFQAITFTTGGKPGTVDVDTMDGPSEAGLRDDYAQYMIQATFRADVRG